MTRPLDGRGEGDGGGGEVGGWERRGKGGWGRGILPVATRCPPSSPVVTRCTLPSSVITSCHSLIPVVTRYYLLSPVSTVVTRRHPSSPVVPVVIPFPIPLLPTPSPIPSPLPFLDNTLITGKNLSNSRAIFTQKFISSPNIIRFLSFID